MMARRATAVVPGALVLLACAAACGHDSALPPAFGPGQVATSDAGMVVSGSPFATDAGVEILELGGNAVDAAVATAFALGVTEPTMSGLGGRTQMLIRATDGTFVGIDGTTQVPRAGEVAEIDVDDGYRTIAVPGTVAALLEAHGQFGTLPRQTVLAPAIRLAAQGFLLPAREAARIADVADRLAEFPVTARSFLGPDGVPFAPGDRLVQPDLAGVLQAIADSGAAVFYAGWIAESIATDMARHGGLVSIDDLRRYRTQRSVVVRDDYRGFEVVGTYLPASGGTVIEALNIVERFDLTARAGTAEWVALIAQALELSIADRSAARAQSDTHATTVVSDAWAALRAREVVEPRLGKPVRGASAPLPTEPEHTTHLSVADADGMLVALTQSVGPMMGSKVVTPGLGFLYAATMGYLDTPAPGIRPYSSQAPLIVMRGDTPVLVLGGAGARRILSAVVEVVSRTVDQGLPLAEAIAAPRFHPDGDTIVMERRSATRWSDETIRQLGGFGYELAFDSLPAFFARIHAITFDPTTRRWTGVADPRWNGTAAGPGGRVR
jgi:gamma-glutamyltranspeptidase/glutathione hydrolase